MRTLFICLVASLSCEIAIRAQEPSPSSDVKPAAAAEIPEGYEVGVNSVSPNGRFAILYPVRGDDSVNLPPNLLVRLKPYAVLTRIGDEDGRGQGARGSPVAKWNGNSFVAIWTARKWGMEDLVILEIKNDQVEHVQPVWRFVREFFDRDFRERFLKQYPDEKGSGVTFVSEGEGPDAKPELEFKGRKLFLNLFADNKPNLTSGPHWTASLHAVWNLDTVKFEKADFRPGEIEVREDP